MVLEAGDMSAVLYSFVDVDLKISYKTVMLVGCWWDGGPKGSLMAYKAEGVSTI